MADDRREISIRVHATEAINNLTRVGMGLDGLNGLVGKSDKELRKAERALSKWAKQVNGTADALGKQRQQIIAQNKAITQYKNEISELQGKLKQAERVMADYRMNMILAGADSKAQAKVIRQLQKELTELAGGYDKASTAAAKNAQVQKHQNKLKADRRAGSAAVAQNLAWLPENKPVNTPIGSSFGQIERGANAAAAATGKASRGVREVREAMGELNPQINATRYALYDVAGSFAIVSAAAGALVVQTLKTGIEFERNFANVVRTTQLDDHVGAVRLLRKEFLELQSTLPATSEELTRIGTLAAQMGIAAHDVAEFTEVTAKFAAASGISAEESATALARVGQILSADVQGNYERLASAILKTGVNAIATEQQIVRGTTQIASIGRVAGLSTVEIVALSSAMSSLGMSPELQRSVITSSFSRILSAVRGSREEAEKFGAVLNMTGQQFQEAWEGDGYNTYRNLLSAISESPNAIGILRDLRLASQRLTPNLLRLGQQYALLEETLNDTQAGWDEEIELQRQYGVIMDTTASKLQVLQQAFEALIVVLSDQGVNVVGDFAQGLTGLIRILTDMAEHPVVGTIFSMATGFGALVAVVAGVLGVVALMGASFLGFNFVMTQLNTQIKMGTGFFGGFKMATDVVNAGITRLNANLAATAAGMGRTAAAARVAQTAMGGMAAAGRALSAALGPISLLLLGITAGITESERFTDFRRGLNGLTGDIETLAAGLSNIENGTKNWGIFDQSFKGLDGGIGLVRSAQEVKDLRGMGEWAGSVWGDILKLDEQMAESARQGNAAEIAKQYKALQDAWVASGQSADTFALAFTDTNSALRLNSDLVNATAEQYAEYYEGVEDAASAEERQAVAMLATADALGLLTNEYRDAESALDDLAKSMQSGLSGFFDMGGLLEQAYGTGPGQGGGLARFTQELEASVKEAQKWADGLSELAIKGAGNLVAAFAAEGPSSQRAVADALKLGPEALAELEHHMANAALIASEAFAREFAADNAILANVFKQTGNWDAVNAVREALKEGLTAAELAGLQLKYDFELNPVLTPLTQEDIDFATDIAQSSVTPVTIPVETSVGQGDFTVTKELQTWIVEMEGNTIVLPVDPNTERGRKLIQEWRDNEYQIPVSLKTFAETAGAAANLQRLRDEWNNKSITFKVMTSYAYNSGSVGGIPAGATGGLMQGGDFTRRAYASGGLLRGPGTGTSDSILARVSNGEFVIRAAAVRHYGVDMIDQLNRMRFPKYATGGMVGGPVAAASAGTIVNATVIQNYPATRDPIKDLKNDAESVINGIWL